MDPLATYGADYKEWLEKNSMLPWAEELVRGVRNFLHAGLLVQPPRGEVARRSVNVDQHLSQRCHPIPQ